MKATGMVRRIDAQGRIVIPKEICRTFGVREGAPIEIFVEGEQVVLQKYDTRGGMMDALQKFKKEVDDSDCIADLDDAQAVHQKIEEIRGLIKGRGEAR